jgi:hypothetical protein
MNSSLVSARVPFYLLENVIATAKTVRTFLISETLDSTPFLP